MSRPRWLPHPRFLVVIAFIYLFLVAIDLLGGSFKAVGHDTADRLIAGVTNPFAGLAVGVLATVLVQSSSTTTSLIIPMAGSGVMKLKQIFPFTLGANIGTTVTALIASLAGGDNPELARAALHIG